MKKIIFFFICISAFFTACTFEKSTALPVGCTTTIFYSTDVKPIIDSKCVSCHVAGGIGTGDFTIFSEVKIRADNGEINRKVFIAKDMPQPGSPQLSEDELHKLSCWLQQGAPAN